MPVSDTPAKAQLAKLPRWAREHIAWQAMRLKEATAVIAGLRSGPADSNVLIEHYGSPDHLLGRNTPVSFRLEAAPGHSAGLAVVSHGGAPGVLELRCEDDALHITPQSSNIVRVRIGPY